MVKSNGGLVLLECSVTFVRVCEFSSAGGVEVRGRAATTTRENAATLYLFLCIYFYNPPTFRLMTMTMVSILERTHALMVVACINTFCKK